MKRILAFGYGLISYLLFLGVFLYAIAFVGDFAVPKTIDSGTVGAFWPSLLMNVGLLTLFALQHSGMARPGFKRWWTKLIPKPIERSTYVLLASLVLALLIWQWRPLPDTIWQVEATWAATLLWSLFALGWTLVLTATFMISHWHLFGLKQVREHMKGQDVSEPAFQIRGFYRYVRHPLNLGFLIAFWATPEMTVGHLVFALATTGYIFVAMYLEERDLIALFGKRYRNYRERVPRIIPLPTRKQSVEPHTRPTPKKVLQ